MEDLLSLTLYAVTEDCEICLQALLTHLKPVSAGARPADGPAAQPGEERLVLDLTDGSQIALWIGRGAALAGRHAMDMGSQFSLAPAKSRVFKDKVISQLLAFNCVIECKFTLTGDENRTNAIVDALFQTAQEHNGFVRFPDTKLYNAACELVFSPDGKTDLADFTPVGDIDFAETFREARCDQARRERSQAKLRGRNIPYLPRLKASIPEAKTALRPPLEVAQRLCALFGLSAYAEAMVQGQTHKKALKLWSGAEKAFSPDLKKYLTPTELEYLEDEVPSGQTNVNFGWRYEACAVLLWALGKLEALPYPDSSWDTEALSQLMWSLGTVEELAAGPLRQPAEILDEADLTLRYEWACVDAGMQSRRPPAGLDSSVVYERHYAFLWLISACNCAEWDDINPEV